MTMQWIAHHGFRYRAEVQSREEWQARVLNFTEWLLLVSVVGLTAFFVISFATL
jgi:hypothetical protein